MPIHPTAIVDRQAEIDPTAQVGPYCIIEGPVRIGAGTVLHAHVHVSGWTTIGRECDIHPFAVLGNVPQDYAYKGERSFCRIGDKVIIREHATVHRGTQPETTTVVGDECLLMAKSHVAHNCVLERAAKVFNSAEVAGHVHIGEAAIVSGHGLVHQFVRVGRLAFVGGGARVMTDQPPFMMSLGESTIVNYNAVGLRRAGFPAEQINEIRQAFKILYRTNLTLPVALARLRDELHSPPIQDLIAFLAAPTKRGHCRGTRSHRSAP